MPATTNAKRAAKDWFNANSDYVEQHLDNVIRTSPELAQWGALVKSSPSATKQPPLKI